MKRLIFICLICLPIMLSCGADETATTISWWHFWTDTGIRPLMEEMARGFEAAHPGVTVELVDLTWADGHDKIAIAFSSGTGPDVVELGSDWIPEFSSTGHLLDITAATDSLRDRYMIWEPGIYDGRHYAFPWILGTRVLYANVDLLVRAGYDATFMPRTWDEILAASRKINDLDASLYGFGSNSAERHRLYKKFLPFLWANGGEILSDDDTRCLLSAPEAVAALEYYLDLCNTGLTDTQRRLEDAFLLGHIGFVISGDWLLKRMENEGRPIPFATGVIPGPDSISSSHSFAGGEYLAVNNTSAHPELALALVQYICSPDNQARFCLQNRTATPSSVATASDSTFAAHPHFSTFIEQLKTSRMPPAHPRWVYIEAELEKAIEEALYEVKTPTQALQDACTAIDGILNR